MRKLILLGLLINSIYSISQPNPQLFQNWYLTYIQGSDLSNGYNVSDIEPPISPTLTISDTFNFTGERGCNMFDG
jgi:heat shock protein HslJ